MDAFRAGRSGTRRTWRYREVAALAARQFTIVANAQLRELGIDRRTITRALVRGALHEVHRGVYSLVPEPARPLLAAEQAAVLACGPRAVLSHQTAARIHGFRVGAVDELELTVVGADRRRPGLVIHRVRELSPADHLRLQRLPVTSVARTVLDLSVGLPDRALEHMIDEALKRTSRARLAEAVGRHPGRPGTPRVKALLDPERPSSDTWSHAEERLLQLVRRAGLPVPEVNVLLGAYIPDLLWRERRIIVEFDSRAHHSGPAAVRRDAARHNDLTSQGYQIIHITWGDLVESPERVVAWIATALARAGG
jgi:very-short-patch-repair endonuclease